MHTSDTTRAHTKSHNHRTDSVIHKSQHKQVTTIFTHTTLNPLQSSWVCDTETQQPRSSNLLQSNPAIWCYHLRPVATICYCPFQPVAAICCCTSRRPRSVVARPPIYYHQVKLICCQKLSCDMLSWPPICCSKAKASNPTRVSGFLPLWLCNPNLILNLSSFITFMVYA